MEEYNNSPFVKRPDGSNAGAYRNRNEVNTPNGFATASRILGLVAIISVFTFAVYPPLMFGATAIILAILSKGYDNTCHKVARKGIRSGIVAIVLDAAVIGVVIAMIFGKGAFKNELNKACKEMYGQTFDDMMQDVMDGSFDLEYNGAFPYTSDTTDIDRMLEELQGI